MKGIILAGDSGSRLHPLTLGVPKPLLPVYDQPMIYCPVETLAESGIKEIRVITTAEHQSMFKKALGDGSLFGAQFQYTIQEEANGIAQAINIASDFIGKDSVCLITGDMIIAGDGVKNHIAKAIKAVEKSGNATIFVEAKNYPDQYGRVVMNRERKVERVVGETDTQFYYSIASLYVFPSSVVGHARSIMPSERGRYEITDVNKRFFDECKLQVQVLDSKCIWFDTNSIDNLLKASEYFKTRKQRVQ